MAEGVSAPASSPSRRYCLYALAVIFFANFLSYLDRQIVSALEKELKAPPFVTTVLGSTDSPTSPARFLSIDDLKRVWAAAPESTVAKTMVIALPGAGRTVERKGHTKERVEITVAPATGPGTTWLRAPLTSWPFAILELDGRVAAELPPVGEAWRREAPPGGFGLDEQQFGYTWTAFTLGYMFFAPMIGFLINRMRRTWIFGACIFLWSLATIWSGLAQSVVELYAARFCIGIGEAGCLVIGPTLLADYFPVSQRGRALSIFFLGLPLGGTAGYIVTGFVVSSLGDWRPAFYAAGLPGIALAALVWLLVDPPRGGAQAPAEETGKVRGIGPYLSLLKNRTLFLIILAQAFAVIILVPLLHFGVEFFEAERHMEKQQATTTLGLIALLAGAAGNLLSGVIGDKLSKRGIRGAYALLAGLAFTAGLPFMLIGFTSTDKMIFLPALTMGAFCYFLCMPAVNTQIANVVTAVQRPMAYAMAVFILHLLGDTFAPPIFGGVSKAIGKQQTFTYFAFTLLLAGTCCLLAWRTARKDEEKAAASGGTGASPGAVPMH